MDMKSVWCREVEDEDWRDEAVLWFLFTHSTLLHERAAFESCLLGTQTTQYILHSEFKTSQESLDASSTQ